MTSTHMLKILMILISLLSIIFLIAAFMASDVAIEPPPEKKIQDKTKAPFDHIKQEQIKVYSDHVYLDINDPRWAMFTATYSMIPVLDAGHNAIQIKPNSTNQIHIGDIVSYKSNYADGNIIHRVMDISEDETGWYMRLKGDNNFAFDPGRVRFDQIESLTVGLIY